MPKSRLYRMLPPASLPFATVTIGGRTYSDNDILEIVISYGKGGSSTRAEVPTAVITVVGVPPISYNEHVTIDVNRTSQSLISRRFMGRVGSKVINHGHKYKTTTITCTSWSIALFRSDQAITAIKGTTLSTIISKLNDELTRLKLSNLTIYRSEATKSIAIAETKELKTSDVLSICEKHGVLVTHNRFGAISFTHAADKSKDYAEVASIVPPLLKSQVLSPATHEQPVAYIDKNIKAHVLHSDGVIRPWGYSKWLVPDGVKLPPVNEILDLTDFIYSDKEYEYPLRAATYQSRYMSWQTGEINIDALLLENGSPYDRVALSTILGLHESSMISLGGDWEKYLQGIYIVQGIRETISPHGWDFTLSLGDPRIVFGFVEWNTPLPELPIYVWDQAGAKQWDKSTKTWEEGV